LFDTNVAIAADATDGQANRPSEHGMSADSIYRALVYLKLTVLAGGAGRGVLVLVLMLVVLYLLDDTIKKVVEKLVRVFVHDAAEVLIPIAKCTWCSGTLISLTPENEHTEGAESGEEGRGAELGNDEGWGRGREWDARCGLSFLGFAGAQHRVGG